MNRFRFYYKQRSYLRCRCRTARLRALLLGALLPAAARLTPVTVACRHLKPVLEPLVAAAVVLRIGDFVIGEAGDPQLSGHPDIRY